MNFAAEKKLFSKINYSVGSNLNRDSNHTKFYKEMFLKRIKLSSFLYCLCGPTEEIAHGPKLSTRPSLQNESAVQARSVWLGAALCSPFAPPGPEARQPTAGPANRPSAPHPALPSWAQSGPGAAGRPGAVGWDPTVHREFRGIKNQSAASPKP